MTKLIETLEDRFPEIAARYNSVLNDRALSTITPFSGYKAWWDCDKGHSWEAIVSSLTTSGQGCAVCGGRQVWQGFNDLAFCFPEITSEWDYNKNKSVPEATRQGTHEKAWWLCKAEGHSWETQVFARTNGGNNCPYCSGKKILTGYNDFATLYPDLLKEWDYDKNTFSPTQIGGKSHAEVRWLCLQHGHSYPALVKSRTRRGDGCPYCSNKRTLTGYNDLATTSPELLVEWDYQRNTVLPTQITVGYHRSVGWKCGLDHTWKLSPSSRNYYNTRCPKCSKTGTSLTEEAFREALGSLDVVHDISSEPVKVKCSDGKIISVDAIGLTSSGRKFVFEYDGSYWHGTSSPDKKVYGKDLAKTTKLLDEGFLVIRIRENALPFVAVSSPSLFQIAYEYKELSKAASNVFAAISLVENYLKSFS
jgi:very-short-patch-repair endonuclease